VIVSRRTEQIVGLLALILLAVGCFVVLRPFVSALLWAAILTFATWPLYRRIEQLVKGRKTLAASLMTALVAIGLVVPFVIVGSELADSVARLVSLVRRALAEGLPPPPQWAAELPLVGDDIVRYWNEFATGGSSLLAQGQRLIEPAQAFILGVGRILGTGVIELTLSVLIAFFLFRDGVSIAARIRVTAGRVAGARARRLLQVVETTTIGVVWGILGTAVAQGTVAGIGFLIAGVPGAVFLALLTFLLSFVPMGPPFVWVPVTIWLVYIDSLAWAAFMAVWGVFVISGVDNVIKPYLISQSANLPFALVLLGVLGGVLAFGFIGLFLGPILLAVGFSLILEWSGGEEKDETPPPAQKS